MSSTNLIEALSFALDLTEDAVPGHALRTSVIGMRIGQEIGLSVATLSDLYYGLILKDVGCSCNSVRLHNIVGETEAERLRAGDLEGKNGAARKWNRLHMLLAKTYAVLSPEMLSTSAPHKVDPKELELLIRLRCDKGAKVIRDLGLGPGTAGAIYCLDERWDGQGYPDKLMGDDIPLLARIVAVSQTIEVFHRLYGSGVALDILRRRAGTWFDPALVRAAVLLHRRGKLVAGLDDASLACTLSTLQPAQQSVLSDSYTIDNTCYAFAGVVDARSPYTFQHSSGVARIAQRIGKLLNLAPRELTTLRRAGLLHDIGKLSVSNAILDKQGPLTTQEWASIRQHPHYTHEILRRINGFDEIATIASSHHEKLDGSGYHQGLKGEEIPLLTRILVVADMFDALSGDRPYRTRLHLEEVMSILQKDTPHALDPVCMEALESFAEEYYISRGND